MPHWRSDNSFKHLLSHLFEGEACSAWSAGRCQGRGTMWNRGLDTEIVVVHYVMDLHIILYILINAHHMIIIMYDVIHIYVWWIYIYIYLHTYSSVVTLFFVKTMLHGLIYSVSTLKCSFCVRSCLLLTSCIISMYPLCYPCISINLFILHALYIIFTRFCIFCISIYIYICVCFISYINVTLGGYSYDIHAFCTRSSFLDGSSM